MGTLVDGRKSAVEGLKHVKTPSRMRIDPCTSSDILEERRGFLVNNYIAERSAKPFRAWRIMQYLGKGGFAKCYAVEEADHAEYYMGTKTRRNTEFPNGFQSPVPRRPNTHIALKIVPKARLSGGPEYSKMHREIKIHGEVSKLRHECIVGFLDHFEDDEHFYLKLELCCQRTLLDMINFKNDKISGLDEKDCRTWFGHIVDAVECLHNRRILHRDIKPGNVFLGRDGKAKLGDFGLAIRFDSATPGSVSGTPNYLAPEVIGQKGHSEASDVWALGCTLFCMLTARPPFEKSTVEETYRQISHGAYSFRDLRISSSVKNLVDSLLRIDPTDRATVREIQNDTWWYSDPNSVRVRYHGEKPGAVGSQVARYAAARRCGQVTPIVQNALMLETLQYKPSNRALRSTTTTFGADSRPELGRTASRLADDCEKLGMNPKTVVGSNANLLASGDVLMPAPLSRTKSSVDVMKNAMRQTTAAAFGDPKPYGDRQRPLQPVPRHESSSPLALVPLHRNTAHAVARPGYGVELSSNMKERAGFYPPVPSRKSVSPLTLASEIPMSMAKQQYPMHASEAATSNNNSPLTYNRNYGQPQQTVQQMYQQQQNQQYRGQNCQSPSALQNQPMFGSNNNYPTSPLYANQVSNSNGFGVQGNGSQMGGFRVAQLNPYAYSMHALNNNPTAFDYSHFNNNYDRIPQLPKSPGLGGIPATPTYIQQQPIQPTRVIERPLRPKSTPISAVPSFGVGGDQSTYKMHLENKTANGNGWGGVDQQQFQHRTPAVAYNRSSFDLRGYDSSSSRRGSIGGLSVNTPAQFGQTSAQQNQLSQNQHQRVSPVSIVPLASSPYPRTQQDRLAGGQCTSSGYATSTMSSASPSSIIAAVNGTGGLYQHQMNSFTNGGFCADDKNDEAGGQRATRSNSYHTTNARYHQIRNGVASRVEMCGTRDSGFDGSESDLARMLFDDVFGKMLHDSRAAVEGKLRIAPFMCPPVFVTRWVDYRNRCGFACELADSTLCTKMTNNACATHSPQTGSVTYAEQPFSQPVIKSMDEIRETDSNFMTALQVLGDVSQYMKRELRGYAPARMASPNLNNSLLLVHQDVTSDGVVMIFNDSTIQVNITKTHHKVVMWKVPLSAFSQYEHTNYASDNEWTTAIAVIPPNSMRDRPEVYYVVVPNNWPDKSPLTTTATNPDQDHILLHRPTILDALQIINPNTFSRRHVTEC